MPNRQQQQNETATRNGNGGGGRGRGQQDNGNQGQGNQGGQGGQGQGRRSNARVSFVVGETVKVFKTTGVRNLKYGVQTSELLDAGGGPNIEPSEELEVIERFGSGKAWCKRQDGSEVLVHRNHIDPEARYYTTRGSRRQQGGQGGQGGQQTNPQERLTHAREMLEHAKSEFESAVKDLEDAAADIESQDIANMDDEEGLENVG